MVSKVEEGSNVTILMEEVKPVTYGVIVLDLRGFLKLV